MKQIKQRILFDDYNLDLESAREEAIERYYDCCFCDEVDDYEPSDKRVLQTALELRDLDFEDFQYDFENFMGSHTFILQGEIGTWRGRMAGGFTFDSFDELSKAWRGCDYLKIYDENGHLYIECSHHDGTNFYEIRKLTEKGEEYLNNHHYDDERKVHNRLMKNPYSVLPNYAHEVWGCKKREYETIQN